MAVTDHEVVAEAGSVRALVLAVERHGPDVCLLDVDFPGGGLQAAAELSARMPTVAVVLLTDDDSEMGFLDAMRAGATGYLPKAVAPEALPGIVCAAMRGEPAIPRALVRLLINEYRERPLRRSLTVRGGSDIELTSREWEVLGFMRDGHSTREIAGRLLISEVTVRRHIGSVLKKLQVSSRADALRLLETA
jgi:DNA-binding NarL/FixJ family response regulator